MQSFITNSNKWIDISSLYILFCFSLIPVCFPVAGGKGLYTGVTILYPLAMCQVAMLMLSAHLVSTRYNLRLTAASVLGFILSVLVARIITAIPLRGFLWPLGIIVPLIAGVRMWNAFDGRFLKFAARGLTILFALLGYFGIAIFGGDFF